MIDLTYCIIWRVTGMLVAYRKNADYLTSLTCSGPDNDWEVDLYLFQTYFFQFSRA